MATWTKPYHGVSHLEHSRNRWLTVNEYSTFTILKMWFEGCGFSPVEKQFNTVEEAKTYGENWLFNKV